MRVPGSSSAVIGLPHHSTRSASRSSPRTRFFTGRLSRLQLFRDVQASKFARLPDRSYRSTCALLGSRGLYIRAERASLPSHASDMLSARLQAIGGTRTFTSQDSQPCRLLPNDADVSIVPPKSRVEDWRGNPEAAPWPYPGFPPAVAVGMPIARHPPHRPVLARLTHTVLTLDA